MWAPDYILLAVYTYQESGRNTGYLGIRLWKDRKRSWTALTDQAFMTKQTTTIKYSGKIARFVTRRHQVPRGLMCTVGIQELSLSHRVQRENIFISATNTWLTWATRPLTSAAPHFFVYSHRKRCGKQYSECGRTSTSAHFTPSSWTKDPGTHQSKWRSWQRHLTFT